MLQCSMSGRRLLARAARGFPFQIHHVKQRSPKPAGFSAARALGIPARMLA
jgi:hypothetical protein